MNPFANPAWRPYIFAVIALLCAVLVAAVLWTVFAIRATQLDNRSTLETTKRAAQDARETSDRIKDCTEPSGRCFEESQKRTGAVVQAIIDEVVTTRHVSVLAAACATDPALDPLTKRERIDAIEVCVNAALAARGD